MEILIIFLKNCCFLVVYSGKNRKDVFPTIKVCCLLFKQLQTAVYRYIAAGDFQAEKDFPTFQDGHNTILVDEAILKSAKEHRWVDVEY